MTTHVRAEPRAQAEFERAAERASALATSTSADIEPLKFAEGLLRAQGQAASAIEAQHRLRPLTGVLEEDIEGILDALIDVARFAWKHGPAALAEAAQARIHESRKTIEERLALYWTGAVKTRDDYLSRAMLRPYVTVLRHLEIAPDHGARGPAPDHGARGPAPDHTARGPGAGPAARTLGLSHEARASATDRAGRAPRSDRLIGQRNLRRAKAGRGHCPFCGGAPSVAVRRGGGGESEGAARSLVCGLCGLEWSFNRILCPACFEADPHKLSSFTEASHPAVRVEACETCGRYVKSIDLGRDLRAVPEVDDLTSISVDLWAVEQGCTRIESGLAGL